MPTLESHDLRSTTGSPALDAGVDAFLAGDAPFKRRLEVLVRDLPSDESDRLMMLMKESRGAWALLLEGSSGRALFVGNAFSGTPVALGTLGFDVTVLDRSSRRLAFASHRAEALVPGSTRTVLGGTDARLPFSDEAFDVVVLEDGLPGPRTGWGFGMDELRRVARREVVVTADNRLGYKRSTGRRGAFRRDPRVLLREVVRPSRGEMALPSTRERVAGEWPTSDAFALYPHAREFSHVVALDRPLPRLTIGPRERKNRLKMLGFRLGLFRWLTPSFAVHARRGPRATSRLDRLIDRIAEATGERPPRADILVATRSNDALVHTAIPGASGPEGRWTIHVALQPAKRRMVGVHHDWLQRVRAEFPDVPVPEPLFHGDVEGADVAVERRVGGQNGTDITGDLDATSRMFEDARQHLVRLLNDAPTTIDDDLYGQLLRSRFDLVHDLVASEATRRTVAKLADRAREFLVGRSMRLGVYHADLRAKHVQVDASGRILGFLDWGASEETFLPFVDLLHLVVHQRKQEGTGSFGDAWRAVQDPRTRRGHEDAALEQYADDAGLGADEVALLLDLYPLLVAGMAERNWDYSRPDWVARQFEI